MDKKVYEVDGQKNWSRRSWNKKWNSRIGCRLKKKILLDKDRKNAYFWSDNAYGEMALDNFWSASDFNYIDFIVSDTLDMGYHMGP